MDSTGIVEGEIAADGPPGLSVSGSIGDRAHGLLARVLLPLLSLLVWMPGPVLRAAVQRPAVGLAWDLNSETNIAGYRIHFGLEPGKYLRRLDVGNTNAARVALPVPSRTYYLAATAYNTAGLESAYSNEIAFDAPATDMVIRAQSSRARTEEDQRIALDLASPKATGPGDWMMVRAPVHGVVQGQGDLLYYVPETDFAGPDSFEIAIRLETEEPVLWSWDIDVAEVREAPTALDAWAVTEEALPVSLILRGVDPDGGPLTFDVLDGPAGPLEDPTSGRLVENLPEVTFIPSAGFTGIATFRFVVSNGMTSSVPARATIEVIPATQGPLIRDMVVTVLEDQTVQFRLDVRTTPGMTFSYEPRTEHGTVSGSAPDLSYTPDPNFASDDTLIVEASDPFGRSDVAFIHFKVEGVNDPPVAKGFVVRTPAGTPLPIRLSAIDPDDLSSVVVVVELPTRHGIITGVPPEVVYVPDAGFVGTDSFLFRGFDGVVVSNPAEVTIEVYSEPASAPRVRAQVSAAGTLTLRWEVLPGRRYDVVFRESLVGGSWTPVSEPLVTEDELMTWTTGIATGRPYGYYAVRLLPP